MLDVVQPATRPQALSVQISGYNIDDVTHFQVDHLRDFISTIEDERARTIIGQIDAITQYLIEMDLGYLSLSRRAGTLSGGEAQRIKLAKHPPRTIRFSNLSL